MKHTQEPWHFFSNISVKDESGKTICVMNIHNRGANGERIIECVNAMAGIENPQKLRETYEACKELELDAYHKLKEEHDQLIELVREMRDNQKEYFKNRTRQSLERSKELERTIDLELLLTDKRVKQPKLFE